MLNRLNRLIGDRNHLFILEVGAGEQPLLSKIDLRRHQLFAVDLEVDGPSDSSIQWGQESIFDYKSDHQFDIIIDSLCWHEQPKEKWSDYLKQLKKLLRPHGTIIGEHAISHENMQFLEENLLYLEESHELLEQKDAAIKPVKFIPPAYKIEQNISEAGLKINRFYIDPTKKIICNRSVGTPYPTDPDLLEYQITN